MCVRCMHVCVFVWWMYMWVSISVGCTCLCLCMYLCAHEEARGEYPFSLSNLVLWGRDWHQTGTYGVGLDWQLASPRHSPASGRAPCYRYRHRWNMSGSEWVLQSLSDLHAYVESTINASAIYPTHKTFFTKNINFFCLLTFMSWISHDKCKWNNKHRK